MSRAWDRCNIVQSSDKGNIRSVPRHSLLWERWKSSLLQTGSWGDVASFWVAGGRLLRVVHVDYAFSVSALMAGLLGDDHGLFCRHWWVSSSATSFLSALMAVLLGDDDGGCSRCLYVLPVLSLSKMSICGTGEQISSMVHDLFYARFEFWVPTPCHMRAKHFEAVLTPISP